MDDGRRDALTDGPAAAAGPQPANQAAGTDADFMRIGGAAAGEELAEFDPRPSSREPRSNMKSDLIIRINPATVARWLGVAIAVLVLANIAGAVSYFYLGHQSVMGLVDAFSLNKEGNVPSYFSTVLLLFAAGVLALIAISKRQSQERFARHWQGLAAAFLFLSVDEATSIHETIGDHAASLAGVTGVAHLYFWLVPAVPLLLAFLSLYVPFMMHVPARYRNLLFLSGAIYVGGAMGFEMVSAWHAIEYGYLSFTHAMIFTIEETLEMSGIALFIYTLLHYVKDHVAGVRFDRGNPDAATALRQAS